LYTLLYLVVQEYTLPTIAQTFLLACLHTLDSGLAQVVCFHLDPAGLALLPCTRTSKTRVYVTPGPSSLPTLMPIPSTTLTPNTKSLSNVQVRVRNTYPINNNRPAVLDLTFFNQDHVIVRNWHTHLEHKALYHTPISYQAWPKTGMH